MSVIEKSRGPDGTIEAKIGGLTVWIREVDGWVDATRLASDAGKLLGNWSRLAGMLPCSDDSNSSKIDR